MFFAKSQIYCFFAATFALIVFCSAAEVEKAPTSQNVTAEASGNAEMDEKMLVDVMFSPSDAEFISNSGFLKGQQSCIRILNLFLADERFTIERKEYYQEKFAETFSNTYFTWSFLKNKVDLRKMKLYIAGSLVLDTQVTVRELSHILKSRVHNLYVV